MMSLLMDGWAPDAPGNKDDQAYVPLKSEAPVWTGFQQHDIAYPLQESVSKATPPASNQNSGSMMSLLLDGWPAPNGVAAGQTQTQNTLHDKHAMTNITAVTTPTLSSNARPRNPRKRALCTHEGCTKIAQSQGLCVGHGGKRCLHPGCTKSAQLQGVCISHGGSRTCSYPGCTKMTRSAGRCFEHGGGKQCSREGCVKQAQARGLCSAHGKR
ncbi:unnamed protein product [Phytophthora lilii]|uniref:Unnamed protein product n=1 Tax=Phytophthora lilii TaxID=2077276 RepID=A0A9W6TAN2_9STRA|nr:unnamed protein product [Phytophthora lilii]